LSAVWADAEIAALVQRVLSAMPPREAIPFPDWFNGRRQATVAQKRTVWLKTSGYCAYCWEALGPGFEIDHVVPRFMGGPDRQVNMLPCCYRCNVEKGGGLPRMAA
jgi:hypothetical protein